jgi:uncharacterized protein (TIGR03086 family)
MQTTPELAPAAAEVARVVAGVRDDQLDGPTPCAGTSVAGLLDHLVGLTVAFRMAAEKTPMQGAPSADAAQLPADWRERLPQQLDALVAAWARPSASEGMAEAGGVAMPAPVMGLVALNEVLVHGWDLAVATGQPYRPGAGAAQRCLEFVSDFEKEAPEARDGIYGPVVRVPDDAPVFDRLLGQTGRDPGWAPAS